MYRYTGYKLAVQIEEARPTLRGKSSPGNVRPAFLHDRFFRCQSGNGGFDSVHVGVLEYIHHHDDLVETDSQSCSTSVGLQHMAQRLSCQCSIGFRKFCDPPDMIDSIDMLRHARCRDIPIIIPQLV